MYNDLSPNLKSSITRSITQTFEQYMSEIGWSEELFKIEDFITKWREYITTKALWYSNIPGEMKESPVFHQELAERINEVIARILEDPPTDEQIAAIEIMQEEMDTHYEYHCKAEASYVEGLLQNQQNNNQ